MYKISIVKDSSYAGYLDTNTVEQNGTSVFITHEAEGFKNLDTEPHKRELTLQESQTISKSFENINFYKILKESDILVGYDGWILKCTVSNGMTGVTVSLWCPNEEPSKTETTKLLKACDKVCNLFPKKLLEDAEKTLR